MVRDASPGRYLNEDDIVVAIFPSKKILYLRITTREPFRFKTGDESGTALFASVATTANSGFVAITQLEPSKTALHLYQVRWGVRTGGRYAVKVPTGSDRIGIDRQSDVGYLTNEQSGWLTHNEMYEFWLVNGLLPSFRFTNNTPVSITPQIYFSGMKYEYDEIKDEAMQMQIADGKIPHSKISLGGVVQIT